MSFDTEDAVKGIVSLGFQSLWNRAMSFDVEWVANSESFKGFNPFGTGQCLSTKSLLIGKNPFFVSIPLEQGNVFRQITPCKIK